MGPIRDRDAKNFHRCPQCHGKGYIVSPRLGDAAPGYSKAEESNDSAEQESSSSREQNWAEGRGVITTEDFLTSDQQEQEHMDQLTDIRWRTRDKIPEKYWVRGG